MFGDKSEREKLKNLDDAILKVVKESEPIKFPDAKEARGEASDETMMAHYSKAITNSLKHNPNSLSDNKPPEKE